jgi:hypothetical protein
MERNTGFASFDPLAIAMIGIRGMESKSNKHQRRKGSTHILLDGRGGENGRREKNGIRTLLTNSSWNGRRLDERGTRSHDPNPLIGHHDRATKSAQRLSLRVHSSAVVTAGFEGTQGPCGTSIRGGFGEDKREKR